MKINKERSENELANYVKFRRGSAEAFKLIDKTALEMDTLYFIYDEDEDTADLYLGSKLISSGDGTTGGGASSLAELSDVILNSELRDKDFLVYDSSIGAKGAWVSKPLSDAISIMVGATTNSDGQIGLVPAPVAGPANRYLRSDGTWATINTQVFEFVNTKNLQHNSLIAQATQGAHIVNGDIVIIKDLIADDKYVHTAYVHQNGNWIALEGNYNADNVYFDEDFIFTEAIGTVEIPESGNTVVEAAGKNLKEFFSTLFAGEKDPEVTMPSATMVLQSALTAEVGSTYTPNYAITFNKGLYSYGPDTAVTATYNVTDSNGKINSVASGKMDSFIIEDDTEYTISATVNYSDGAMPFNNLNHIVEEKQIQSGSIELTTNTVRGYRNAFYGTFNTKQDLTSDSIRSLFKSNKTMTDGSTMTINVPVGAMRVVIAYDANLRDLTSVFDKNDSDANIVSGFGQPKIIEVEGADGHSGIDYKVYTLDFANPYDTPNVFSITI